MDVTEAVQSAKDYVTDLFAAEKIRDVGLEEVDFDESQRVWNVTVGFARPWDDHGIRGIVRASGAPLRTYKVVRVRDVDGVFLSVKHRNLGA